MVKVDWLMGIALSANVGARGRGAPADRRPSPQPGVSLSRDRKIAS
ncbi:hypothetical protein RHECNPAF_280053 [Rhizobium etli CNPAF512]|nr:hypothetical protein RHECNPAF_280053 [Rhizobium etli CNPAF512]